MQKLTNEEMQKIQKLLLSLEFGSLTITVQNGKIVQVDKNEKLRLSEVKL